MWEFLSQPTFQRLAVTLLHFLWQGAAVAIVAGAVLRAMRRSSSNGRYAVSATALFALTLCPVVTFCVVDVAPPDAATGVVHHAELQAHDSPQPTDVDGRLPESDEDHALAPATLPADQLAPDDRSQFESAVAGFAPYIIACWMLGVAGFGLRLMFGFVGIRRLLRDRIPHPVRVSEILAPLARRLRFRVMPRVACSARIAEAMVVGFFRPVILLPVAWAAEVPEDVLRSVLAHELAHIRRRDQWVNLLQRVAEVVLFYHPAVWWISRQMRAEREYCCDEMAATAVGGGLPYAEALEAVGRLRAQTQSPLLSTTIGGTNMSLLSRVKNVLGKPGATSGRDGWTIVLLAVSIPLMICVSAAWWPTAQADDTVAAFDEDEKEGKRERARENKERAERERGENRERRERAGDERRERGERREREAGERRERDRERGERDRRERGERREGDRERGERRERDRERGERDRERGERRERDGDRRREGDRERGRDGDRKRGDRPRGELAELLAVIRQLRTEVARLRKDVDALKRQRGFRPPRREGGPDARRPPRREGDRPRETDRPRRDGPKREGADRREGPRRETDRPRRETDRPRREGDKPREGDRRRDDNVIK